MKDAVVLGATSLIGHFLLPRLVDGGYRVAAVSRSCPPPQKGIDWIELDASQDAYPFTGTETLISLAPIWVLATLLQRSRTPPGRIIAFSSTSAVSKQQSPNPTERRTAEKLLRGEALVRNQAERSSTAWTILRPTMVYGAGLDKNVTTIAGFIERFGFFPLVGEASGLRSPVHAEDLATSVLRCLATPTSENRLYTVTGGEEITYRTMVARIFAGLGRRERVLSIPNAGAKAALRLASLLPRYAELTPEMADRANVDLVFNDSDARRDFGHAPRPFHPHREDLLRAG